MGTSIIVSSIALSRDDPEASSKAQWNVRLPS